VKTTALHNAAYAVLVSWAREHSQNAHHNSAPHSIICSTLPEFRHCPLRRSSYYVLLEVGWTGSRRYVVSGLRYNRHCVLGSATRVYYLVRLRIPPFSSHTNQIKLSFPAKDHEIYLKILIFWDVTACYGVSSSRRFEKTRCPSSIFPARFHIGITMKIQVVRDVTPGRWGGCSRGFEEMWYLLVRSLGSPWRWKHQRLRNVKNH
jgi:hypothetical protein